MLESLIQIDEQLLAYIRSSFGNSEMSNLLVTIFADSQVLLVSLFLVLYWLYGVHKKDASFKVQSLHIFFAILCGFGVYLLINLVVSFALPDLARARPELVSSIPPLISHLPDNSFPSGHAIFAASASYGFFSILGWSFWSWIVFVLGIVMCFMRIAAGVHFPGDIFAGYVIGLIFSCYIFGRVRHTHLYNRLIEFFLSLASKIYL